MEVDRTCCECKTDAGDTSLETIHFPDVPRAYLNRTDAYRNRI